MIDPIARWRQLGLPDKPDYAGLLTFMGLPYTEDAAELEGVDVAIVGAPVDDLTSDRPGARFGPRAIRAASCPPGPHLEARVDAVAELRMHDVRDRGIRAVVEESIGLVGEAPVFLSVDVDVLDPAFAPGTGTPEPGGLTSADLLWACREIATRTRIVGMDVVEVIPTAVGSCDITALVAERIVRESVTGIAARCVAARAQ